MRICADVKALSTLTVILLIIIAAIMGGIIAYAFTIAAYVELPERTTLTITDFYFDKENATSFRISVLNPSYSPTDATINGIAVSLKRETQLYYAAKTEPSIENGLVISSGESLNVTCFEVKKDDATITFGEFASEFAGKTILVHVFSPDSSASNVEVTLPLVKLNITADFNPQISFKKFNVTLINDVNSEVNLTITSMSVLGIPIQNMTPNVRIQPVTVPKNSSLKINFDGDWHGLNETTIILYTQQGYIFRKEVKLKIVNAAIQNVTFNENYTDRFNVTIFNSAGSATYVTVEKIVCTLEDGTTQTFGDLSVEIMPNSSETITLNWNWEEHRGETITVVAHFAQDFETLPFEATIPQPQS